MKSVNRRFYRHTFFLLLLPVFIFLLWQPVGSAAQTTPSASSQVILLRAPDGGIQPQAVLDSKGTVHLIYYKGESSAGDIYYVRQNLDGQPLGAPIRVNSQPNSAAAIGWVRGAQIAVGKNDRVHVVWNGSRTSAPRAAIDGGSPMLYTRLNDAGTAFEPQRDLITRTSGVDGGGALAADGLGNVYVFWHASAGAGASEAITDEASADVFVARSTDNGKTFAPEEKANPQRTGACGCCAMKAFVDAKGILYVLYRAAGENVNRDTTLLISGDKGKSFESRTLVRWRLEACPLTVYSVAQDKPNGTVFGAWKNQEQVYFAALNAESGTLPVPVSPSVASTAGDDRKYQVVAANAHGEILLAWVEGVTWGKGGTLWWQVFDRSGKPVGERGRAEGAVPAWSLVTAFARPDGRFGLIF